MFHPVTLFVAQVVKAQAIFFELDKIREKMFQIFYLRFINQIFEDRILYALPVVLACLATFPNRFCLLRVYSLQIIGRPQLVCTAQLRRLPKG